MDWLQGVITLLFVLWYKLYIHLSKVHVRCTNEWDSANGKLPNSKESLPYDNIMYTFMLVKMKSQAKVQVG